MSLTKWKKDEHFPSSRSIWDDFFNRDFFNQGFELGTTVPAMNTSETDSSYNIELAIPGFKKEDLNIEIDNGMISISSQKEESKEEKNGEHVTRTEFNYSSFQRSFRLPENVKDDEIGAVYEDGLLKLTLPKSEPEKVETQKKIEVL